MNTEENAEIIYNPGGEEQSGTGDIQSSLVEAERQLAHRKGVNGMGMTKLGNGDDAIVVYVLDQHALSQLPELIDGVPVIGEITGEIKAQ